MSKTGKFAIDYSNSRRTYKLNLITNIKTQHNIFMKAIERQVKS